MQVSGFSTVALMFKDNHRLHVCLIAFTILFKQTKNNRSLISLT